MHAPVIIGAFLMHAISWVLISVNIRQAAPFDSLRLLVVSEICAMTIFFAQIENHCPPLLIILRMYFSIIL